MLCAKKGLDAPREFSMLRLPFSHKLIAVEQPSVTGFLERLAQPFTGEQLFDYLPDTVFFIKDGDARYLAVNETLIMRCGVRRKSQLIGRTTTETLDPELGRHYEAQDREVIASGRPLLNKLEMHISRDRSTIWCITTKLPLTGRDGTIIGLVGISRDLRLPDVSAGEYKRISSAILFAEENLANTPTIAQLAAVAGMTEYQLERRMRLVFDLTTGQWLRRLRMERAQHLLQQSDLSIVDISMAVGYADQSAFTRQFRKTCGLPPSRFRSLTRGNRY